MSSSDKKPPVDPASQQGQQQYFPPPPGPPPVQTGQTQAPKHSNETPIPDYNNPSHNPTRPQFAPPPTTADDDIYDATPTNKHAPRWGHQHQQDHQHHEGDSDAGKKKPSKFAAFGAAFASKVAGPVNALANKLGSEGFLPESLDKECEKAARILRGFCKDGIYSEALPPTASTTAATPTPTTAAAGHPATDNNKPKKSRVLLTIPSKVIARAQGLAIFTAVRLGFQATGSSGSGILLARLPDGSWSPPSGIQITSIGAGFVAGVDIYDCVIVINTREALELFTKTRLSLGSDLAVTAGPFGAGGALDWGVPAGERQNKGKGKEKEGEQQKHADTLSPPQQQPQQQQQQQQQHPLSADNTQFQTGPVPEDQQGMGEEDAKEKAKKDRQPSPFREAIKKPVYSYVKSRGLFAGVQIDGTVVAERESANARFYGQAVPVAKILKGEVPAQGPPGMWPVGSRVLFDVLKGAEGWRGQQQQGQQGRPVSPLSPGFAAPVTTATPGVAGTAVGTGAPPNAWVPPPPPIGVSGVAAGMQNLSVGSSSSNAAAGPSSTPPGAAPPPMQTAAASAKAAEAAAEAARAESLPPPPPMYSELQSGEDLPPAYVEDESRRRVGGDSKTGQH